MTLRESSETLNVAAAPVTSAVRCDKGVDMARVQALVKKTVNALKKDQARVIQEINQGDRQWKDGDYYSDIRLMLEAEALRRCKENFDSEAERDLS